MTETITVHELAKISRQLILWNQHPAGSYVACPLFSHYGFSWLRDGSFIAYAMDIAGEKDSAGRFYEWVRRVLDRQKDRVEQLLHKHANGETIAQHEFLHTRYHLDGRDDDHSEWGHFQLDGYGAWLWGVAEHWKRTGIDELPESFRSSVELTIRYLCAFWKQPNFDCWEERNDQIHPSTLACIYGGLSSIHRFVHMPEIADVVNDIRLFLLEHCIHPEKKYFVKSIRPAADSNSYDIGFEGVDASLMWLAQPFQVFGVDHAIMNATLAELEARLKSADGGVRRYVGDEYYGGGEWILLTAWYGWIDYSAGQYEQAAESLQWIARQADAWGRLPEQVFHSLASKDTYEQWVHRWGTPATPLLWSHAMYLVLYSQLYG
ncbi:glycoside hydrolase family 15 protein [Paenibacillus sp. NPDC056579]|uniref:glycoside hydrolase family 15 protein n=1 Tax=Paenibacillus sp. NPDC056579 TaxID=3345871 RepID=UPI003697991D